jgi:hypothetical protein
MYLIGSRALDHPACSVVPQPTTLLRAHHHVSTKCMKSAATPTRSFRGTLCAEHRKQCSADNFANRSRRSIDCSLIHCHVSSPPLLRTSPPPIISPSYRPFYHDGGPHSCCCISRNALPIILGSALFWEQQGARFTEIPA